MKFGDEEWFKKLNEMVKFPKKFSYFYNRKENRIHVCSVESKAQLDNIRWKDLRPDMFIFVPNDSALITVKEIRSAQHYYDEVVQLMEAWGAEAG